METYYDLPVVKAAPWRWYVPAYFYAGGLSGAAATLQMHALASIGHAASGALLIADLGRPARFYKMLRVPRPTSPMSVGTWILTAAGASSALALVKPSRFSEIASACAGAMLSTYTGVLIGNTAVPVWKATRRRLPLWFAAASSASLASLLELGGRERRAYSVLAKTADLVGAHAVERAAEAAGVARPLRESRKWRVSKWLGAASLIASLWPGTGRKRTLIAGALGTASALLARFAVIDAGRASADDPRATFGLQQR